MCMCVYDDIVYALGQFGCTNVYTFSAQNLIGSFSGGKLVKLTACFCHWPPVVQQITHEILSERYTIVAAKYIMLCIQTERYSQWICNNLF